MKKAVNVGIATGIIISIIFIAGSLIRRAIPQAAFENRGVYFLVLGGLVALVFWMAMRYYSRSENVKWGRLNITGFVASFIAAIIFSAAGFMYTRYIDPGYLSGTVYKAHQNWLSQSALAGFVGRTSWIVSPSTYAWNNFQDMLVGLIGIALVTATVFYMRNKNKVPQHPHDHHGLLF
ncbi:MAG TPA: DUF4199 domain-containing protein [Flavitalea sp.]|nr:DUF4199 domain-containing protein [Flavitalea sp.]